MTKDSKSLAISAVALAAFLFLAGCSIKTDKNEEKKGSKVDIDSPVGSLHVETNEKARSRDTGLPVYPGAREAAPDEHDNTKSANVSMGFAGFGLKVVAAQYESDDSPEKLIEFYRPALAKFGQVTECRGDLDLDISEKGEAAKPKCKADSAHPGKFEMGAARGGIQHVVSIKPKNKGSEFALIYIATRGKDRETM